MNKIRVTWAAIKAGIRGDNEYCALALALKRRFPYAHVIVYPRCLRIGEEDYALNKKLAQFMSDYDNHRPVKPFSFDLDELEPFLRVKK